MEQRRAELDAKRQKLQELRKQRAERRKTMTQSVGDEATAQELGISGNSSFISKKQNIDDLVSSLVGERTNSTSSLSIGVNTEDISFSSNQGSASGTGGNTPLNTLSPTFDNSPQLPRPSVKLEIVETVIFDQPPKEKVLYSKEVQTNTSLYDEPEINEEEVQRRLKEEREKEEQLKQAQLEEEEARALELEEEKLNKELTEEERLAILTNEEFLEFINSSTKVVERALSQPYDYLVDYTQVEDHSKDDAVEAIKLTQTYFDERLTHNRSVMDIDWSIKYPELFLGAYNKNLAAEHDPDGLVCVWNTHLTDRAEFIFHAPSDVLTAKFSPFHPNYIVGGTYTGQILLWDTRSKRLPVLKSPLNSTGHTHPVYNLSMIGTHNAHNCITASSDGMICAWQLDLLAQPQEVLELLHPSPLRADDLGITALDFPTNETATFWVGTEEGAVYQINRYDRAGIKVGVHPNDIYTGHSGPITSLHFHPQVGALDFSDLFLTTSFDWTVKLWQAKSLTRPSPTPTQIAPLASFEHGSDYILDAQWSPSHPGAFGSVDAGGNFSVWNLNHDLEIPTSTLNLTSRGLNKIRWDKDGSKAAIGASDGKIYVCEVPSLSNPHSEDGAIFQKTVSSLTRNVFNKD